MNPNIYELSKMTKEQYDFIMKRAELDITEQMKVAKEVSDDVKARGDEAVLEGFIPISFVYAWYTGSCCESS